MSTITTDTHRDLTMACGRCLVWGKDPEDNSAFHGKCIRCLGAGRVYRTIVPNPDDPRYQRVVPNHRRVS